MGVEEGYVRRVQGMGAEELRTLWGRVKRRGQMNDWAPGRAFEFLVLRAFQFDGAEVVWPYANDEEQVDGAVYVDGLSCLVESKDHAEPLNFDPIAKLAMRLERRPRATVGLLFSTSGFTSTAIQAARFHPVRNVLVWRREEIDLALAHGMRAALRLKWRKAVEEAALHYELQTGDFR